MTNNCGHCGAETWKLEKKQQKNVTCRKTEIPHTETACMSLFKK